MKKRSKTLAPEPPRSVETFVLAGARATGDPLAEAHGVSSKAHITVAGTSMIGRVLDAVSQSAQAGDVTVIGLLDYDNLQITEAWPSARFVDGEDGPAASVDRALGGTPMSEPFLVTTCDHALLTPMIVDKFLRDSTTSNADLTVALARRADIEARYPDANRTYLKFGDGDYSSCNLFCLLTPAAREVVKFWQAAEQDRKRPWRIAWRFGVIRALRLLIGRPDLDQVFAIISGRLGVNIRPVVLPFADAAIDVDKPEDLTLVERVLSERSV
ncbi:MAG: nucleotidyltransferase family protein [Henriciella sp.]|nr:nucleotidyltransferase family protein [Henriciella sp.]